AVGGRAPPRLMLRAQRRARAHCHLTIRATKKSPVAPPFTPRRRSASPSEVEGCRPDHLRQGWLSEGGRPALQEAAAGRHLSNVYSRCLSPIHYRAPFNWRPTKFIVGVSFWTLRLKHRLLSTRPLRL